MVYSVDRIEGELAVLIDENELTCQVSIAQLPAQTKEGDMLRLIDGQYILDDAFTQARREQILQLQNRLRHK